MNNIRVKKFNPATIKPHRVIFMIGRRGSGKSSLLLDLLSHMPKTDFVFAMAPTEDTLEALGKHIPESCLFNSFSLEKIERMLTLQTELIRRGKQRSITLILDDCMYQKGLLKSTCLRNLLFNGRHKLVTLIVTAQYAMDIPCEIRSNIDYVCTMRDNTLNNRQKLHKNFFGMVSFPEFDKIMTACTQNFSALILDCTIASMEQEQCIFWYKANISPPEFRLGRDIFWGLARRCARSDDDMRREQEALYQLESSDSTATGAKSKRVTVVQKEDENGKIVSSA